MSFLFAIIKIWPFIGFPMTMMCVDIAVAFKRKGNKKVMLATVFLGAFFFISSGLWVGFRGDKNSDQWYFKVDQALFPKIDYSLPKH